MFDKINKIMDKAIAYIKAVEVEKLDSKNANDM